MTKRELEHLIRAAGEIAEIDKLIIFGSQSILAQLDDNIVAPADSGKNKNSKLLKSREVLTRSIEADIMIPGSIEKTELVEAVLGELSQFHDTFGYYAQGVDLSTSKLPEGWEDRLIEICNENTNGISGMCLEIHDLIIAKLYAARKKDIDFYEAALNSNLVSIETLENRLSRTLMSEERKRSIKNLLEKEAKK